MEEKVAALSNFIHAKHTQIFTNQINLVKQNLMKVLELMQNKHAITTEDLDEFQLNLDKWQMEFTPTVHAKLTKAMTNFVESLALADYQEMLDTASNMQQQKNQAVRHSQSFALDEQENQNQYHSSADDLALQI